MWSISTFFTYLVLLISNFCTHVYMWLDIKAYDECVPLWHDFETFGPSVAANEVSTIFGIIFLFILVFLFLCHILFSQKGLSYSFEILHGVLSQKKEDFGWTKIRDPPCAWGFHEHSTIATK